MGAAKRNSETSTYIVKNNALSHRVRVSVCQSVIPVYQLLEYLLWSVLSRFRLTLTSITWPCERGVEQT